MDEGLRVTDLSVQLRGRPALRAVSMTAPLKQVTAVLGPNGAGKSTLLRAICGLLPHAGEVSLRGRSLTMLATHQRAHLLSFVPQRSELTAALPVRDLVMQGRYVHRGSFARPSAADRGAVDEALHATDTQGFLDRPFSELSAGEQRRVLIARALATGAETLLLDEPSAALDIEHALRLYQLLQKLARQGRCVVVALHELEHARAISDRAVLLSAGSLVAQGEARDVLSAARVRDVYGVEMIEGAGLAFRLPGSAS